MGRQGPLLRRGNDAQGDGQVIAAALLVQIRGCQVDDNLLPGDAEPLRLQRCHRPQKALLHRRIGQSHQMNPDPQGDIHFHRHRNRLDPDALRSMYIYQHISFLPEPTEIFRERGQET